MQHVLIRSQTQPSNSDEASLPSVIGYNQLPLQSHSSPVSCSASTLRRRLPLPLPFAFALCFCRCRCCCLCRFCCLCRCRCLFLAVAFAFSRAVPRLIDQKIKCHPERSNSRFASCGVEG